MKALICIFFGGGVGSILRYGVQLLLKERIVPYHFPLETLVVNIVGSFLIGLFYALSARFNFSAETRLLLTTGLCGGFTTFSTFSNDSLQLLKNGFYVSFSIYVVLSVVVGILAVFAGAFLGNRY